METENLSYNNSNDEIANFEQIVKIISKLLPIVVIVTKIFVLLLVKDSEGLGDKIEIFITTVFFGLLFYSFWKIIDLENKNPFERIEIPQNVKKYYNDRIIEYAEKEQSYIGVVKIFLKHDFKELTGQLFSTIIAIVGLWIPDTLSESRNELYFIIYYLIVTLFLQWRVSRNLAYVTNGPIVLSDYARLIFCGFANLFASFALIFLELFIFFKDKNFWIVHAVIYISAIVFITIYFFIFKIRLMKAEKVKIKGEFKSLTSNFKDLIQSLVRNFKILVGFLFDSTKRISKRKYYKQNPLSKK